MEAIKFSSFRLLVSNSLSPFPAGLGAFGISCGTGSCMAGFGSTLGDDAGSLPTGVTDPSVGLRFLFSGSLKRKNKVLPKKKIQIKITLKKDLPLNKQTNKTTNKEKKTKKTKEKEKGNESRPLLSLFETLYNYLPPKAVWIISLYQTAKFELQNNFQSRILKIRLPVNNLLQSCTNSSKS